MESVTQEESPHEVTCFALISNALGKGMKPSVPHLKIDLVSHSTSRRGRINAYITKYILKEMPYNPINIFLKTERSFDFPLINFYSHYSHYICACDSFWSTFPNVNISWYYHQICLSLISALPPRWFDFATLISLTGSEKSSDWIILKLNISVGKGCVYVCVCGVVWCAVCLVGCV